MKGGQEVNAKRKKKLGKQDQFSLIYYCATDGRERKPDKLTAIAPTELERNK